MKIVQIKQNKEGMWGLLRLFPTTVTTAHSFAVRTIIVGTTAASESEFALLAFDDIAQA